MVTLAPPRPQSLSIYLPPTTDCECLRFSHPPAPVFLRRCFLLRGFVSGLTPLGPSGVVATQVTFPPHPFFIARVGPVAGSALQRLSMRRPDVLCPAGVSRSLRPSSTCYPPAAALSRLPDFPIFYIPAFLYSQFPSFPYYRVSATRGREWPCVLSFPAGVLLVPYTMRGACFAEITGLPMQHPFTAALQRKTGKSDARGLTSAADGPCSFWNCLLGKSLLVEGALLQVSCSVASPVEGGDCPPASLSLDPLTMTLITPVHGFALHEHHRDQL